MHPSLLSQTSDIVLTLICLLAHAARHCFNGNIVYKVIAAWRKAIDPYFAQTTIA